MTPEAYKEELFKEREYLLEKLKARKKFLSSKENKSHPNYDLIYQQAYAMQSYLHYLTMELEQLSPTFAFINDYESWKRK